jgi:streptogramin lyase
MSDRPTDRDVEQTLTAWMAHVAPARPPSRVLESTFARTMRSRQLRRYPWSATARVGPQHRSAGVSRAMMLLIVVAVLLVAAAAVGLVAGRLRSIAPLVPGPTPTPTAVTTPAPSVGPSLPAAEVVAAETAIPVADAMGMVGDGQSLWVMAPGRIDRIDTGSSTATGSVTIGDPTDLYNGVAANAVGVWATDWTSQELVRVNPTKLKVAARIPAGLAPKGILANADGVWVADTHGGTVLPIDVTRNRAGTGIKVAELGTSGPNWFGSGQGSIWVDVPNNGTIARIDARTNRVTATVAATNAFVPCGGIAVDVEAAWVSECSSGTRVARLDPTSNTMVAAIELGGFGDPMLINGRLWISVDTGTSDGGFLARIDPATNSIDRVVVPDTAFGGGNVVVAAGSAWLLDAYHGQVLRLPLSAFGG